MSNNTVVKKVLILTANPANTSRLRLDEEVREIEEALRRANLREQFKLEQKWAVRKRDFYLAILDHKPHIVHFCGHSTGVDGIVLEDDTGQPTLVDKEALSRLFKLFAVRGVECVFLNTCYSETQAQAISQYIKYVIGMNQAIGDKAAISFAREFYNALGAGETVDDAFEYACIPLVELKEDQTPILKKTIIHSANIQFEAGDIPPNPYLGLSAFGEKDAAFFFGRETFTEELFQRTHQQPLVAVIGASGSGKSSVVFAGLIPRLLSEGTWLIESLRPKSEPFDELAQALVRQLEPSLDGVDKLIKVGKLAETLKKGEVKLHQVASQILENKSNKRFLLVVDQFEELYTQCLDKEQQSFIDTLLAAIQQKSITLVFTLRADFYGYVLSYRPFGMALQQFKHTPLTLMSQEELKTAIEQPAQKLNVELQTHLAERILDDVGNEPGNLPLLEFALTQLWDYQKDGELTHRAYDEIGCVKKALANHAQQVYIQLSQREQKQAERIFMQLVRPGEGTEDTRRIATRAEVGNENWRLVSYLAGYTARLVVTGRDEKSGEDTVEIVHEALIREWLTLQEWIKANRDFRVWQERLRAAKEQWKATRQDQGSFLRGAALAEAEEKLKERPEDLIDEKEFIEQSIQERERIKQVEVSRRKREIRTAWGITAGSLVAGVISSWLGLMAWNQNKQAELNRAKSLSQYSLSLYNENKDLDALVTAINAGKILQKQNKADSDVISALLQVVYGAIEQNRWSGIKLVSMNPTDKSLALVPINDKSIIKLMSIDGRLLKTFFAGSAVTALSWSRDGKILSSLVSVNNRTLIKLWSIDGQLLKTFSTNASPSYAWHTLSFDGNILATNGIRDHDFESISLWNRDGNLLKNWSGHRNLIYVGSLSPDGKILAVGNKSAEIQFWDMNGNLLKTLRSPRNLNDGGFGSTTGSISQLAWSPDGKVLAAGGNDHTIQIWDHDGKLIANLQEHTSGITSLNWSRLNGQRYRDYRDFTLVSSSDDGTINLWQYIRNSVGYAWGWMLFNTIENSSSVNTVNWTPDGKNLVSLGDDNILHLWNLNGAVLWTTKQLVLHTDSDKENSESNTKILSPNGKMLASINDDSETIEIRSINGQLLHKSIPLNWTQEDERYFYSLAWSPDSKSLAFLHNAILINTTYKQLVVWEIEGKTFKKIPINSFNDFEKDIEESNFKISWSRNSKTIYLDNGSQRLELSLDLNSLLVAGCGWIHEYLKNNHNVEESDRHLCDDVKK